MTELQLLMEESLDSLTAAERAVAEVILSDVLSATRYSTADLAAKAKVSPPTIGRLAKRLGCAGFPDMKLRLAASIAPNTQFSSGSLDDSSDNDIMSGLLAQVSSDLDQFPVAVNSVDLSAVEKALASASRIEFYGVGASAAVAADAQHRFFRMGLSTVYYEDVLKQRMAAVAADESVAIVLFSFTGRTSLSVEVAQLAKASGATLIAVTRQGSPLAREVDYVLPIRSTENTELVTPMSSRILMMLWVDLLSTAIYRQRGEVAKEKYRRVKNSLKNTRI
ncbi:MAG: SIS domain-containing protein [Gammaproteobacteria bacterium]|nr:SIS domain-containing protein [Gammaproteobacteria bacterium]